MPKKARELTVRAVAAIKGDGRYAVGGADGLMLRVSGNARSWILRIVVGDKRRDIGLGSYSELSLAAARDMAWEYRRLVKSGVDPITKRTAIAGAIRAQQAKQKTFKECAEALISAKAPEWKNAKHRQQWENTLAQYAYPSMGKLLVAEIAISHVMSVLDPIWRTKTETASRLRGRIEAVLDFATVRGYRTGENPARWKGHLDKLLPQPNKTTKREHQPALPFDQIHDFMGKIRMKRGITPKALEFLILTAARSGEVRGATWDEIDLETATWTVPAERMKAKREHRVPLSKRAMAVLEEVPLIAGTPYVFPAPRGGMLSDMALTAIMRKMHLDAVPHGFRSTFRDWAGERTNYPRELAEQALAHATGNAVEQAYRRGDSLEKRRKMMQAWADFIDLPPATATVTPINKIA